MEATACKDYKDAINRASAQDNPIIVMGSLYFIGEVLDIDALTGVGNRRAYEEYITEEKHQFHT